jgi:hypothetical protein
LPCPYAECIDELELDERIAVAEHGKETAMHALVIEQSSHTRRLRLLLLVLVILALAIGANAEAAFASGSRVMPPRIDLEECSYGECAPTRTAAVDTTRHLTLVEGPRTVEQMHFLEANLYLPEAVDLNGAYLCYTGPHIL